MDTRADRAQKDQGKAKLIYYTTLTGLVRALEGQSTIIDLRNESYVSGVVHFVDGNMNVEMRHAMYCDPKGVRHYFSNFLVKNRIIRYVHVPEHLNPKDLLINLYQKMHTQSRKKPEPKQKTFKKRRAERYNQQTVSENFPSRPGPSGVIRLA